MEKFIKLLIELWQFPAVKVFVVFIGLPFLISAIIVYIKFFIWVLGGDKISYGLPRVKSYPTPPKRPKRLTEQEEEALLRDYVTNHPLFKDSLKAQDRKKP